MNDYFFIQNFVNNQFESGEAINHEAIAIAFQKLLKEQFDNKRFSRLLIHSGYIPDLYSNDSSEETLYTKLIEVLVAEWADRMGFTAEIIKQKASMEDIKIYINGSVIVCDAKSFRLGRSQQAPNAKDFLKLEDIRKWMDRYEDSIGGLVTYPCTHEWKTSSDIYQYCSTKDAPTIMLPYKYLAFLFDKRESFDTKSILELWNYNTIFPDKVPKNAIGGNKALYWKAMNAAILRITKSSSEELEKYMIAADKIIAECVNANLAYLQKFRTKIVEDIKNAIQYETDVNKLKRTLIDYKTARETELLDKLIERIKSYRL